MGDGYLLTGKNLFFNGTNLAGADNVRMPGVRHFSLPKQEQTLTALVNGINSVSGGAGPLLKRQAAWRAAVES